MTALSKTSFDAQRFLSPEVFPDTIEKANKSIEKAQIDLMDDIDTLMAISDDERNFINTIMAYHRAMLAFDVAERMIRSERLLPDETPGKTELLQKCIETKNRVFSDPRLLRLFITYAEKMLSSSENLSPLQWEYLKGHVVSIRQEHLSPGLCKTWQDVKQNLAKQKGASYEYLQGSVTSKILHGQKKNFSLITLNLCFMPLTTSMWHGGFIPWPDRMDRIAAKLRTLDADIICLQEVYDEPSLKEFKNRLSDSYAHFYGNVTPRLFGLDHLSLLFPSGLAVISKFELENVRFEPFSLTTIDKPSGCDRLNLFRLDQGYGLFHFDVMNGGERLAHLGTTHLNPFFAEVRESQMRDVLAVYRKVEGENGGVPMILCGDLNVEKNDPAEGGDHLIKQAFEDPDHSGLPSNVDFNDYWLRYKRDVEQFKQSPHVFWTIDRVLPWKSSSISLPLIRIEHIPMNALEKPQQTSHVSAEPVSRDFFEDQLLSDHDGIFATIEINSK